MIKKNYEIIENTSLTLLIKDIRVDSKLIAFDAEKVVEELLKLYGSKHIFYMDKRGEIHELKHDNGKFSGFRSGNAVSLKEVSKQTANVEHANVLSLVN